MDTDGKLREDVISPLLKVSTYKGYTLTGPKEVIVRRVYSSQVVSIADPVDRTAQTNGSFTQLNFRALGTSPSCMLSARARLVVPLRFVAPSSTAADAGTVRAANFEAWDNLEAGHAEMVYSRVWQASARLLIILRPSASEVRSVCLRPSSALRSKESSE